MFYISTFFSEVFDMTENSDNKLTEEKCIEKLSENIMEIYSIPKKAITYKVAMFAVEQDGSMLECIPNSLIDNAMIDKALDTSNGEALEFVPSNKRSLGICIKSVHLDGQNLRFVDPKKRTEVICEAALNNDADALEFVPEDMKPKFYDIVLSSKAGNPLKYFNPEDLTEENCDKAISVNGEALSYVPFDMRTPERCLYALEISYRAYPYIPDEVKTKDFFQKAVVKWPQIIQYIKDDMIDEALCLKAVKNNGLALKYVDKKLMTDEMIIEALKNTGKAIFYVPQNKINDDYVVLAMQTESVLGHDINFFYNSMKNDIKSPEVVKEYNILEKTVEIFNKNENIINNWIQEKSKNNLIPGQTLYFNLEEMKFVQDKKPSKNDVILDIINESKFASIKISENRIQLTLPINDFGITEAQKNVLKKNVFKKFRECVANNFQMFHVDETKNSPYKDIVSEDGLNLKKVPENKKTYELCLEACKQNGLAIRFVPKKLLTDTLCQTAFDENPLAFVYMPDKFKTKEMALGILEISHIYYSYIPESLHNDVNARFLELYPDEAPKHPEIAKLLQKKKKNNDNSPRIS